MCDEYVSRVCAVSDDACGPHGAAGLVDVFQCGELGADDPLSGPDDTLQSLLVFHSAAKVPYCDAVNEY